MAMAAETSPSTGRRYGIVLVAREFGVARSTVYAGRERDNVPAQKRGPAPRVSDDVVLNGIRDILAAPDFNGEGHRKVWARLRLRDIRVRRERVLRLMREANLLAPVCPKRVLGPRNHDGTIVTKRPDEMWGTDLTTTLTLDEGQAAVFIGVDHCTAEIVGIHASRDATRFEALEPLRQGVRTYFGSYGRDVARGLKLRHDHGSQYVSDAFQGELIFLGIESSPAFVRSPEGNGCAERIIRTLKEQLLWVRNFRTVEELRLALLEWAALYNTRWLIGRHGYKTPAQMRAELTASMEAAA